MHLNAITLQIQKQKSISAPHIHCPRTICTRVDFGCVFWHVLFYIYLYIIVVSLINWLHRWRILNHVHTCIYGTKVSQNDYILARVARIKLNQMIREGSISDLFIWVPLMQSKVAILRYVIRSANSLKTLEPITQCARLYFPLISRHGKAICLGTHWW